MSTLSKKSQLAEEVAKSPEFRSFLDRLEALAAHLSDGRDDLRLKESQRAIQWIRDLKSRKSSWRSQVLGALETHGFSASEHAAQLDSDELFEAADRALGLVLHALLSFGQPIRPEHDQLRMDWGDEVLDATCSWQSAPDQTISLGAALVDALDLQGIGIGTLEQMRSALIGAIRAGDLPLRGLTPLRSDSTLWELAEPSFTIQDDGPAYQVGSRSAPDPLPAQRQGESTPLESPEGVAILAEVVACRLVVEDTDQVGVQGLAPESQLVMAVAGAQSLDESFLGTRFDEQLGAHQFDALTERIAEMISRSPADVASALESLGIKTGRVSGGPAASA